MTRRIVYYRADKPGKVTPYPGSPFLPFGAFAVSARMQGLMNKVGRDTAGLAKMFVPSGSDEKGGQSYRESFVIVPGSLVKIKGLRRVSTNVVNTADHAAALEFGSGEASGDGEPRPQGGGNLPKRPLGKAGMMMGDFHSGE